MDTKPQTPEFSQKIKTLGRQQTGKTGQVRFPGKLRKLLEDAEKENNEDIVGWLPDGLSFKVHKPKEFAKKIMPRYFSHSNIRSFQRQLYHYNFIRVPGGESRGAYRHPNFSKNDKSQCPEFHSKEKVQPTNHKEQNMTSFLSAPKFDLSNLLNQRSLQSTAKFDSIMRDLLSSHPTSDITACDSSSSGPISIQFRNETSLVNDTTPRTIPSMYEEELTSFDVEPIPLEISNLSSIEEVIDNVESLLVTTNNMINCEEERINPVVDPFMSPLDFALEPTPIAELRPQTVTSYKV